MSATPITDSLAAFEADQKATTDGHRVTLRRAYMAGALEALTRVQRGERPGDLLAQCAQYGRVIGTAAERAK